MHELLLLTLLIFLHLAMLCCSSILFYLNVFVFCTFWSLHFAGFVCLLLTFSQFFFILLQIHYIIISNRLSFALLSTSLLHWILVFHTHETHLILKRNMHFSTLHWSWVAWIWSFRKDIFEPLYWQLSQDWVAFMSQPYWVKVKVELRLILGLWLIWGWGLK